MTKAQKRLLLAMYAAGPRIHHCHDLGERLPPMMALKRAGLVTHTASWRSDALWRGKLTTKGRAMARELSRSAAATARAGEGVERG